MATLALSSRLTAMTLCALRLGAQDYAHEVLAQTGGTLTSIGFYTSINDSGMVAFPGAEASGTRTYVVQTAGNVVGVTFNGSTTRNFDGAAINNESPAQVATRDRVTGPAFLVRKWSSAGNQAWTVIGRSPTHFDSGLLFVDINDSGVTAFTGLIGGSTQLALFAGAAEPPTQLAVYPTTARLRPQIANDGRIVIRDPNRILTWSYPGGAVENIAGASNGFTSLGDSPGISQDGRAVAFIGDRGQGEGVFVSVLTPAGRSLFRVAGERTDAFTDLDELQRVGVTSGGTVGGGQIMTVAFVGTRSGTTGIHTVDFSVWDSGSNLQSFAGAPLAVARIGDTIGGITVSSLSIYDPINACGVVAFRAGDATRAAIVRATRNVVTAKVSVKRVLGPRGQAHPAWTTANINSWMIDATSVFQKARVALQVTEIVDLPDPHVPVTWFGPRVADKQAMEQAAESDPCRYKWRTDAVNVYLLNTIVDAGGLCSFPHGSGPYDNDLVLVQPGILNGSMGLAHELGHYFNLRHTHANHEGLAGGCPGGVTFGDCVDDTRADADPSRCSPFSTACHNTNLTNLANGSAYTTEELRSLMFNLMSYHGPITAADAVITCGQAQRARDSIRRSRGNVLVGASVPTIAQVTPSLQAYPGPSVLTLTGSDLPTTGVIVVGAGRRTSSTVSAGANQVVANFAQPLEPGSLCVCIKQDQKLRAFREAAIDVTPSLHPTVSGAPPQLALEVVSSAPGSGMVLFVGAPLPPVVLPGFLFQLEALPTLAVPFATNAQARAAFAFSLAGRPPGAANLALQCVEIGAPSSRFSNAVLVYVP